jgi:hypothetical protein
VISEGRPPERPGNRSFAAAAIAAVAACLLLAGPAFAVTPAPHLLPSGDTYVSAVSPHHNFGRAKKLRIDGHPRQVALLRFNVSAVQRGQVGRALLYLYPLGDSPGIVVRAGSRGYWHEKRVTYRSRLRLGATLARTGPLRARRWTAVDVTRLLGRGPVVQIALEAATSSVAVIASREAPYVSPRLVLERPSRPAAAPKVVMAVGDTCSSGGSPECAQVAQVIRDQHPDAFIHLGDMQYQEGTQAAFDSGYGRIFADLHPITYPVFGETHDFGWNGYPVAFMNQHSAVAGRLSNAQWGYSYDLGAWHVVALDYAHPDPAALAADLAAHPSQCLLAVDHAPWKGTPSSTHPVNQLPASYGSLLEQHGVDLILNGHNHVYERWVGPSYTELQVGTGGIGHYSFLSAVAGSVIRSTSAYGAVKLVLSPSGWTSQFIDAPGSTLTDTAAGGCGA